jgi:DNA repair photolyase
MITAQCKGQSKPPSGTQEWAASNVNIQDGCEHDCRYCYAKTMALRFKRMTAGSWKSGRLRPHDLTRSFSRRTGRIMFPTAHDITDSNLEACLSVLHRMLAAGNDLLIVSKPRITCTRRLCEELARFKEQLVFRFSIGSVNDAVLGVWEPGAPAYCDRLASLKHAYTQGFKTSVSCEPMLDGAIDDVITDVRPYVTDSIWLGKANRLRQIIPLNCPGDAVALRRAEELIAIQSDTSIRALYARYRQDPLIKWKDSIKQVIGLARPLQAGLDL